LVVSCKLKKKLFLPRPKTQIIAKPQCEVTMPNAIYPQERSKKKKKKKKKGGVVVVALGVASSCGSTGLEFVK
jgi:hypothetical protein